MSDWPLIAGFGWLNRLINYPADLDLSYHYRPVAAAIAQSSLIRRITEIESRKRSLLKKGHLVGPEINDSLESAISLRNQIQRGLEKLFLVSLLITVRTRRISDLNRQVAQIETLLAGHLFGTRPAYYQQLPGFGSTRPRGHNFVGAWRNLDSSCAALTWPFVGSELTNPAGILYGINQTDNSLVLIDRFSLANSNSLIFAQSGAGKSYAAKVEILRQLLVGVRVIVIDPENEYQRLAIKAGGAVIRLGPGSPNRLNLFDRLIWGDDPDDNQRLSDLATIIEILIGSIDDEARLILEAGLDRIYRTKQTQIGIDDLIGTVSGQRPDIGRRLVALKAGPLASLVQEETRIGSEPSLVVFSLDDWPDRYRAGVSLLISAYVAAMGRRHMNKRLLVIDEAWMLLGDRRASSILAGFVRRARKNYIGVCLISQQADDFLSSEAGRTIAAQSALKLILRTDTTAIRTLSRQFRLSEIEQQYLLTAAVGHGLLIAETKHTTVAIVASKEEHPLITTDPAEKDSQSRAGGQQ